MALIAQVIGDLDLQSSLHHPPGELAEQPARADDLLRGLSAGQQLVNNVVRSFRRISSGTRPRISDGVAGVSPEGSPPAPSD